MVADRQQSAGEVYAERLAAVAQEVSCDYERLRPAAEDWNEQLHPGSKMKIERRERKARLPHARRPRQG
ncbi:hypothetical protein CWO89_31025 [Bradyrhizobium sp. Leo170]|nr:hypothetical protein CWO90_31195 [Bradyrhizobium sp. Leo121]TAI62192.1 hypothetical protein CWO89_31025 [Bradyrhizobium sp. Leo170]